MIHLILSPGNEREIVVQLTGTQGRREFGTVRWSFRMKSNKIHHFETKALFVPDCNIKLLSPQAVFQEQGRGSFLVDSKGAMFTFPNSDEQLWFQLDAAKHCLPDCTFVEQRICQRRLGVPSLSHQAGKPEFDKVTSRAFQISLPVWTLSFGMDTAAYASKKSR